MKMYLLEETGRPTRIFWTFEAADIALTERLSYWCGINALVTEIDKEHFEGYLEDYEIEVSITEVEVEG